MNKTNYEMLVNFTREVARTDSPRHDCDPAHMFKVLTTLIPKAREIIACVDQQAQEEVDVIESITRAVGLPATASLAEFVTRVGEMREVLDIIASGRTIKLSDDAMRLLASKGCQ